MPAARRLIAGKMKFHQEQDCYEQFYVKRSVLIKISQSATVSTVWATPPWGVDQTRAKSHSGQGFFHD
jgi:hypothetical protein